MNEANVQAWIQLGSLAISAGQHTAESLKALFQSSGIAADDATLDRIVTEASTRKAARDAEAAMPDPPQV